MTLALSHDGGWEPIPSVAHIIRTPPFSGSVAIGGVNQTHLTVAATVVWPTHIPLGTDMIKLVGHPTSGAAGLQLGVELVQEEKGGDIAWTVSLEAGIKLFGDHPRAPPVVGFAGSLNSDKHVYVAFETTGEWTPLAGIMVCVRFPRDRCTYYPLGHRPSYYVLHPEKMK